jgi:hypothetical protein
MNTHTRINAPTLYSKTMTPDVNGVVASIERKAAEDRKVRDAAAKLAKVAARIAESSAPADFLGTTDGLALVNLAFDLTGCDALYDLAADIRHEFAVEDERQGRAA